MCLLAFAIGGVRADGLPPVSPRRDLGGILTSVSAASQSSALPTSIDGLTFVMVSSTASTVNTAAPTSFDYHQDGEVLWGEYVGDTVRTGRFVGRFAGGTITLRFAHELKATGQVVLGEAESVLERREDGLLYLIEAFEKNGVAHESICVQA